MNLPPPAVARRIAKFFALLGSTNDGERAAAYAKLTALLTKHSISWNDLPEILAATTASGAPQPSSSSSSTTSNTPSGEPEVNVLDLVLYLIERRIAITPAQRMAVALWILHCWIFDRYTVTPRLMLTSPIRGCGKTTLLALIEQLVPWPWRTEDISPAAVYRLLEVRPRTCFLVDEADNSDLMKGRILRSLFNANSRGGGITRYDPGGAKKFPAFAPLGIGAIGALPLPLMDRSLVINMKPAPKDAGLELRDDNSPELGAARKQIRLWEASMMTRLDPNPETPFHIRLADNWRPLFAIADNLGHGEEARAAALDLNSNRSDVDPVVVLITDIQTAYTRGNIDRMASEDLVTELLAINDYWLDWNDERPGRKLNQGDLARMLRRAFHIRSRSIWPVQRTPNSKSRKGFTRDQFERAWADYCTGGTGGTAARQRQKLNLVGG